MKKYFYLIVLVVAVALSLCYILKSTDTPEYNLSKPDEVIKLPKILKEISGITVTAENQIACVEDETGTVFIYDISTDRMVNEYENNLTGDFEGIALVGTTMYVLRSDGMLVEYKDYTSPASVTIEHTLNLPSINNEGLCYDKKNNRLLIAAKSKTEDNLEKKSIRLIYGFDLKTKKVYDEPIFRLHIKHIQSKAIELNLPNIKTGKHKDDEFNFRPSEIAVNPIDSCIYILSGKDKLLLITNMKGTIKNLIALDETLFKQAEGITFLSNGDMLISNEGQKGKPTLLLFKYKH
ncbi:MAG: hypothetical protein NTX97_01865 [Bacteroidetes bacterium]|nr:hypothetical protein [Bacteroidota bacterium]